MEKTHTHRLIKSRDGYFLPKKEVSLKNCSYETFEIHMATTNPATGPKKVPLTFKDHFRGDSEEIRRKDLSHLRFAKTIEKKTCKVGPEPIVINGVTTPISRVL